MAVNIIHIYQGKYEIFLRIHTNVKKTQQKKKKKNGKVTNSEFCKNQFSNVFRTRFKISN